MWSCGWAVGRAGVEVLGSLGLISLEGAQTRYYPHLEHIKEKLISSLLEILILNLWLWSVLITPRYFKVWDKFTQNVCFFLWLHCCGVLPLQVITWLGVPLVPVPVPPAGHLCHQMKSWWQITISNHAGTWYFLISCLLQSYSAAKSFRRIISWSCSDNDSHLNGKHTPITISNGI